MAQHTENREQTAFASTIVEASRSEVWDALTDPAAIEKYFLGAKVSTDWNVGSPITWTGEWKGEAFEDKGEILAHEPQEELCFSHWSPMSGTDDDPANYHVVTITLSEADDGTRVELAQSNLRGGVTESDRENRDHYEQTWSSVLDGLKRAVEDERPA